MTVIPRLVQNHHQQAAPDRATINNAQDAKDEARSTSASSTVVLCTFRYKL